MKYKQIDVINRAFVRAITDPSLYEFNRIILAYPDINKRIHEPMCANFQAPSETEENDYALLLLPRNSMKTTFTVVGGCVWILALDPNQRILIVCSNEEEAKKRLKSVKDQMIQSDRLKYFYGELAQDKRSNTWRQDSIMVKGRTSLDIEPSIDCAGRGTDKTGQHYNWVLCDDLENNKSVESSDELDNTKRYFRRLEPCMQPKMSRMRITGTRWSYDDLYSMILGEEEIYRGAYDFFRRHIKSSYNDDGTLWYPERLTKAYLDRARKIMQEYMFSCNFLNKPVVDSNAAFNPLDVVWYYGDFVKQGTAKYINVEKVICNGRPDFKYLPHDKSGSNDLVQLRVYICVDPALSDKDEGCYSGIVVVGRDLYDNRIWVLDALRVKSQDPLIITDAIMKMYFRYEPLGVILEDQAWQLALKTFFMAECKKNNIYPNIQTVGRTDHRSKHERILGLSQYWKSNALMLPIIKDKEIEDNNVKSLLDELLHFPRSKTVDLADALSRVLDVQFNLQSRNQSKNIQAIESEYQKDWE